MKVALVEDTRVTRSQIVWVVKGDDEDWGSVYDDTRHSRFEPNRVCFVVRTNERGTFSNWMQVRRHYYGDPARPDREECAETYLFEGEYPEYAPEWLLTARDLAVQAVVQAAKGDDRG